MAGEPKDTEKLRKVVALLAGENCGKCGFQNCGEFALAMVEGKSLPTDCRKSINNLKEICQVLGIEVPERAATPVEGHRRRHGVAHGPYHHHGHKNHNHARNHHGHGIKKGAHHHTGRHMLKVSRYH